MSAPSPGNVAPGLAEPGPAGPSESPSSAAADDTAGFVLDMWYFAALACELKTGELLRKELVGEPVVLGRTADGTPFALRDICAHRAAPLSAGRLVDGDEFPEDGGAPTLECPYHGWRFRTADGACASIPSLVAEQSMQTERIKVRRFPLAEKNGLIWIYVAADKRFSGEPDLPPPELPVTVGDRPNIMERSIFECHFDQAVVGLVDPAHGPYVHQQWWWRTAKSIHDKQKTYVPSELGFTMVGHTPSSNSQAYKLLGGAPKTEISFRLPGIRTEAVTNQRYTVLGLTAVTPQNAHSTEFTQLFYWNAPILSLLKPLVRRAVKTFLRQDGDMVTLQGEGLKYDPNLLLVDDADMLAKWYFRCKREWAASRADGRDFVNPVQETTLRWRS